MSSSKSHRGTSVLFSGLMLALSGCDDSSDLDALDSPAFNFASNADDDHSVDILPEITSENHPQFKCPPDPEPCVIPTPNCAIQSVTLLSLQNNSGCGCGPDVSVLWSVKAPGGIIEGEGAIGVKKLNSFLDLEDSIPLDITPKGNGMYEISHKYLVNIDADAYTASTTWSAGLKLTTNCPNNSYFETTVKRTVTQNILSPCLRNDKIIINLDAPASILGSGSLICWGPCDWNYASPTHHRVDIFDVTGGGKTFVKSELVGWMDVKHLPYLQAGKKYRFEYRNVVYKNGVQQCATATPFVETVPG